MIFTAELESTGGNTAGFVVPDDVVEALGAGRRPKVVVTLGDHTWRSSIASMGGRMMLGVSAANREAAGAAAGATYDVEVVLDDQPRTVEVPPALAEVLEAEPALRAAWEGLSFTHQREHAEAISGAKQEATRERRVAKAVALLRERAAR